MASAIGDYEDFDRWSSAGDPHPAPVYVAKTADFFQKADFPRYGGHFPATSDRGPGFSVQVQQMTQEVLRLKTEAAEWRSFGRTAHIICSIAGLFFFGVGLIPGFFIGWAVKVLVYNHNADALLRKASAIESYLTQLQQNPYYGQQTLKKSTQLKGPSTHC